MPNSVITIRDARATDSQALADLAEATFRETYTDQNTADNMQAYCANTFGVQIQREEIEDEGIITLLVEVNGALAGYAQLKICAPNPCAPETQSSELRRIYLLQDYHGQGFAQELMKEALNRAWGSGAKATWLGVWKLNPRAITFYKKFGFEIVGEQTFLLGKELQEDLLLYLSNL